MPLLQDNYSGFEFRFQLNSSSRDQPLFPPPDKNTKFGNRSILVATCYLNSEFTAHYRNKGEFHGAVRAESQNSPIPWPLLEILYYFFIRNSLLDLHCAPKQLSRNCHDRMAYTEYISKKAVKKRKIKTGQVLSQ